MVHVESLLLEANGERDQLTSVSSRCKAYICYNKDHCLWTIFWAYNILQKIILFQYHYNNHFWIYSSDFLYINIFRWFLENTILNINLTFFFLQFIQSYFTANICGFYRMYLHIYSFKLHLWKIGWLYHVRFIYFLKLSTDDLSVGKIAIQSHTYPFPVSLYW